ncbi:DUF2188 domain-containing protein [Macrococcus equipercicus]|uniref:DUF2188 domain-containing protein n=1 Tax=Macrococcus equipercicus TaxID=69967 RepID=A0ABQ6R6D8_9STAP|nr:DUF2188 domain-containing protein [Macrococcus equipercicus]KAA1036599.1 DUF2188 domain-containing protein [Macrococcus equipercicus]
MWTTQNYPDSWKNLDELERKKAFDIGNAMLTNGYKEADAIPIATSQAEKWYKDASVDELKELKNKKVSKHSKDASANPELMDEDVEVYYEEDAWKVKTVSAKRASGTFSTKKEAVDRAKEIAGNKGTKVIQHNKGEQ